MKMSYSIGPGVVVAFDEKPGEAIRGLLKRHGFRWNAVTRQWWRSRVKGAADVLQVIEKAMRPKNAPDGHCWHCGQPGRFRSYAAATPLLCDPCWAEYQEVRGPFGGPINRSTAK